MISGGRAGSRILDNPCQCRTTSFQGRLVGVLSFFACMFSQRMLDLSVGVLWLIYVQIKIPIGRRFALHWSLCNCPKVFLSSSSSKCPHLAPIVSGHVMLLDATASAFLAERKDTCKDFTSYSDMHVPLNTTPISHPPLLPRPIPAYLHFPDLTLPHPTHAFYISSPIFAVSLHGLIWHVQPVLVENHFVHLSGSLEKK